VIIFDHDLSPSTRQVQPTRGRSQIETAAQLVDKTETEETKRQQVSLILRLIQPEFIARAQGSRYPASDGSIHPTSRFKFQFQPDRRYL